MRPFVPYFQCTGLMPVIRHGISLLFCVSCRRCGLDSVFELSHVRGCTGMLERRRPVGVSAALMAVTVAAGVVLRFAHLGQPFFVRKYGGSAMWALAIYWVVSAVMVRRPQQVARAAAVSGAIGTAVEFLKLVHTPWLEWFRGTLPGILLLGRYFAWADILAYWVAIGLGAAIEFWWMRRSFGGCGGGLWRLGRCDVVAASGLRDGLRQ